MSSYPVSAGCLLLAIILVLESPLTGRNLIPYAGVVAIIGGLISLKKFQSTNSSRLHEETKGPLQTSILQHVVGIGLWLVLKFGSLKSMVRWSQPNVKYRTIGNHYYAEVEVDDGSRRGQIYVPLIRGRYQIRVANSCVSSDISTDVPYTAFYSSGHIWSIPIRPKMLGYNKLQVELSDSSNPSRIFEFSGSQLVDLQDVIEKYKMQIQAANTISELAEAYD